ncbi:HlyD family efflux transporter periplasmic adaptor subunit [Brumimicrobium mesophilum]|uniref:HlyD family efflux transporter periplasmic adaptor subunit n=1 Tax=Brumimicrobium mesophilum TaxID=392717 RepID=UPI000D13FE53|nr:HlyD family secretion protein [Brumimicrobium mesophilum]
MKSYKFLNILFSLIIIGLITIIFFISNNKKQKANEQLSIENTDKPQLFEVYSQKKLLLNGVISAKTVENVQMKVSGKLDKTNASLYVGREFKKNEVLIKVERLEALYEILTVRSEFMELIQKLILSIRDKAPDATNKWIDYESQIERTLPLPTLPEMNSKKEEELLNRLNVFSKYYKTKEIERKAEDYVYLAPFDGLIIECKIHPQSTIQPGKTILKLAKKNSYQIVSHIPISELNRINRNDTIDFTSNNGELLTQGRFFETGTLLSDSSTIEVYFSIFSQESSLLKNSVQFKIANDPVKIPSKAIRNNEVEVISGDKTFKIMVKEIEIIGDSSIVEGLPQHSIINVNP